MLTHLICLCLFLGTYQSNDNNIIQLTYGENQQFKHRHDDINILGHFSGIAKEGVYQLNDGKEVPFYVKGIDVDRDKISRNRLFKKGDFNIEIPITSKELSNKKNRLEIRVVDSSGEKHSRKMTFTWNKTPVKLPLDLTDLSAYSNIQEIGQVVDGAFEFDPQKSVIRTTQPVGRDALLLLGSPHGSQEATYSVRFSDTTGVFLGLADFFAGHEAAIPPIGIKPGWSSAGLATIGPDKNGSAQTWLAWGDLLRDDRAWVVKTDPPKPFDYQVGQEYRVRQQVLFQKGVNRARFKIWPAGEPEPDAWLCEESDQEIPKDKMKFNKGTFGLFQFQGQPTEWFHIKVVRIE